MRADETRKISENFKKQPYMHQRKMVDRAHEYESRHSTEEICSVCGLSKFEIDWQEKKGIEDKWCKLEFAKSESTIPAGGRGHFFDKSTLNQREKHSGFARFLAIFS